MENMAEMNIDTKIPGGLMRPPLSTRRRLSSACCCRTQKGTFESSVRQLNVEWHHPHSRSNLIKRANVNISEAPPLGFARLFN